MKFALNKKIIILAGLVLAALAALVALTTLGTLNKVKVEVVAIPEDSSITLDGEPIDAGVVSLEPGTHTLTASREFFTEVSVTVHTDDIVPSEPIYLLPIPSTPEAFQLLEDNPELQQRREAAGAIQAEQKKRSIESRYPYIGELPHTTIDYKVDYGFDDEDQIFIEVTLYPPAAVTPGTDLYRQQLQQFKDDALGYLESIGVDTDQTEITFSPDPND